MKTYHDPRMTDFGPEVSPTTGKERVSFSGKEFVADYGKEYVPPQPSSSIEALRDSPPRNDRTIYGLSARAFWSLIAIIAILVIGAAVGGGVGGSLATKAQYADEDCKSCCEIGSSNSWQCITNPIELKSSFTYFKQRNNK
jgi:hypothetical protein